MASDKRSLARRLVSSLLDLLPGGGIGQEGPAPDIDGKRDTDADQQRAVLRAKSQMSSSGQGTTSYESVHRGPQDD